MKLKFPCGAAFMMAVGLGIFGTSSVCAQPGLGFPIVTIAGGQSARVNALNLGSSASTKDSSCSVTLQFLDTQGQQLKQSVLTLTAGKGGSLDLNHDALAGDNRRVGVRVVLLFGYSGGARPGPDVLQQFDCNIVPSLEVYDNDTQRTGLILTDVKPLPVPNLKEIAGAPTKL